LISDKKGSIKKIDSIETELNSADKSTLKEIANLEIQIESIMKNNERFEILVEKLILLRSKLRNEKNYELSDEVRDILESSGLQIEDSEQGIQWKVTE
jgi:cysteinyl-tRNA synthetase